MRNQSLASNAIEENQYLTFILRGELFAIGILNVKEIREFGPLTSVPMMPDFIKGVINLRGSVVPVLDLSARFGHPLSEPGRRSCVVVIEVNNDGAVQDIGIIVDAVSAVLEIPPADIEAPPAFGSRIRADFIEAMGKIDDRFVVILNIAKVLSVDELAVLEDASDESADTE